MNTLKGGREKKELVAKKVILGKKHN